MRQWNTLIYYTVIDYVHHGRDIMLRPDGKWLLLFSHRTNPLFVMTI